MPAADRISLAIVQMNPTVGDLAGNASMIERYYQQAAKQGAGLVVFPEMALVGYPPEDLILSPDFRKQAMQTAQSLAKKTTKDTAMLFGCVWEENDKAYNAALLCSGGKIAHVQYKTMLPNEGIFDEKRLFTAGSGTKVVEWNGLRLGVLICEDVWHHDMAEGLKSQKADIAIVINASPFEAGKLTHRYQKVVQAAQHTGLPVVYVNMAGAQDDIVFDGGSFVASVAGKIEVQLPEFSAAHYMVELAKTAQGWSASSASHGAAMATEETLWSAMKQGLFDYVGKNRFSGVVLGLSGGIDSALTAALAVDALGADRVTGVLLPSHYTSQDSTDDAQETARLLGIRTMEIPITDGMETFEETLTPVFQDGGWMTDTAIGGNLQARLRGITLMALSNKFGWMLLSTGNKSELAVGYSTLYGDSCGGYNVIKDLYKTQVYALAKWRNAKGRAIPERSITKAPTAELAPGQKDEDQLPPYSMLDKILELHIEGRQSAEEIITKGFAKDVVEKVLRLVRMNEYKRRQSCPGVKLSAMLFGRDRRYPLTNKF
jgi:NAD+ synthase